MITTFIRQPLMAIPLAALTLAISSAYAAPSIGSSGEAFYTAPASLPSTHGELVSYRPATVNLGSNAPTFNAWNVLYTTANGMFDPQAPEDAPATLPVTGTVLVPTSGAVAGVILYAVGTHGLAPQCAASKQLAAGTDYEAANIAAALKAGYAVLVTDYVGYTTGSKPRYMAGKSQGRNVLDIFKAATSIPGVGFTSSSKVGIWGYSQGGQSSSFAAQLQPTYAPGMNVVGVATGGIPGDFFVTADYLNGKNGSSFLLATVLGLTEEYGETGDTEDGGGIPFNLAISDVGRTAAAKARTECVFEALFDFMNKDIAEFTKPTFTLAKMVALPNVKTTLQAQQLGNTKINFPVYQYHGAADEFIPLGQAYDLKKRWCANGTNVSFDLFPSEHIATQFQAAPQALAWLGARFAGTPANSSCSASGVPTSTANSNSGDLLVSLDKWKLAATVDLKTLKQTVILPEASTFSANTDITAHTLDGDLSVPDFKQGLKLLGIGAQIGLKITPTGRTTGTVALDNQGILSVKGAAPVDITVTSVWGIPFGQCKTSSPVQFPLDFSGPISSLGNGNLTFKGTTNFPMITGCIISAIISAFMSGNGQGYTFTVSPPAPVKF